MGENLISLYDQKKKWIFFIYLCVDWRNCRYLWSPNRRLKSWQCWRVQCVQLHLLLHWILPGFVLDEKYSVVNLSAYRCVPVRSSNPLSKVETYLCFSAPRSCFGCPSLGLRSPSDWFRRPSPCFPASPVFPSWRQTLSESRTCQAGRPTAFRQSFPSLWL